VAASQKPGVTGQPASKLNFNGTLARCEPFRPGPVGLNGQPYRGTIAGLFADRSVAGSGLARSATGWIDLTLVLAEPQGTPPVRTVRSVRIESADAAESTGRLLSVSSSAQAREIAAQLAVHPESAARLIELRGGVRIGLADWAATALLTRRLKIFVPSRAPGGASKPPPDASSAPTLKRAPGAGPAPAKKEREEPHWIEIAVTNESGAVMAGVAYLILTAEKQQHGGVTDSRGRARLDDIVAGPCQISFPDLDDDEWKRA
jgi:hypothetical protein